MLGNSTLAAVVTIVISVRQMRDLTLTGTLNN